jgi:long-chain acyl-CoA synthetase
MNEQVHDPLARAAARGMSVAYHAAVDPHRMAIVSPAGRRSFGELNARANQLACALRTAGVTPGDGIALLVGNRPEFVETHQAALRIGARVTPINWHLGPDEVAYVVDDSEAIAFVAEAALAPAAASAARRAARLRLRLSVGGEIDGFAAYDAVLARHPDGDLEDPILGSSMLYTSGTTGRPKGVFRQPTVTGTAMVAHLRESAAFRPETDSVLITGPLYHAAPLATHVIALTRGVGSVLMGKWDAEETLALIARHRITHTHLVATMFQRLLNLPDEVKARYDITSLRWVSHGAAPTPVHVKQRMIAWWGPILYEYYAATEGGTFFVDSEEWLRRPGTVGRSIGGRAVRILDEAGNPVPVGRPGYVYFVVPPEGRFEYFKAPEKTAAAYRGDFYTLGDIGYLDEDGYLFLTGRSAETIISGGVNIYPQEVDDALSRHPAVYDVCTIGVPDEEWGESVKSVVELQPGYLPTAELERELLAFCRQHLAAFKCPRSVDFRSDLPRLATGKILRREVRAPYWAGRDKTI